MKWRVVIRDGISSFCPFHASQGGVRAKKVDGCRYLDLVSFVLLMGDTKLEIRGLEK
jgi:hypothetical protein